MSRGRSVRLSVYFGITITFMARTVWNMFEGVRPFDWLMLVVEIAVLLLILYEVVVGIRRHQEEAKRTAKLALIVASLATKMDEGYNLQITTPNPQLDTSTVSDWIQSVRAWAYETEIILNHHSLRAVRAFTLVVDSSEAERMVYPTSGMPFYVTGNLREAYQRLLAQLNNLRNIIEKPEVYF
jgi:hypothetical protein